MRAYIVVDLGFGDSGKGLVTDFLVRHLKANLVVRYNGGAQAGHNVVTPDGLHHTFSQFGSGTFIQNTRTYLSRYVVLHPTALLVEGALLEAKGVSNPFLRIRISDQALVITPFHQAANRIREILRGANRHGSCGVGVGETVEDSLLNPETRILAGDLNDPSLLKRKLQAIREQKRKQITLLKDNSAQTIPTREYEVFNREDVIDSWIATVARLGEMGLIVSDSVLKRWLGDAENVIFEGAQGVLLDEDGGFHPFTTWSRCTTVNAINLIQQLAPDSSVFKIGVTRPYMVRHGPGPLPTETEDFTSVISEHNKHNEWQGTVRYGWFDAVLARYAMELTGGIDTLVVTHMDLLSHLNTWKYCLGYQEDPRLQKTSADITLSNGIVTDFRLPSSLSLAEREKFTHTLSTIKPVLVSCSVDQEKVLQEIETLLKQQVGVISRGPRAENVELLSALPM